MYGAEAIHPAGGPAATADRGDQFNEGLETVFETAIGRRLKYAEQPSLLNSVDNIVRDAPVGLGFLGALACDLGDGAGARQQLRHVGFARSGADGGHGHEGLLRSSSVAHSIVDITSSRTSNFEPTSTCPLGRLDFSMFQDV